MQYSNGDFSTPADGTLTQVSQECPVHANVQPWLGANGVIGERMYNIPAGGWFRWRYMTKDGRFVLGRTPSTTPRIATTSANGTQDWGFAKAYCVPTVGTHQPPRN